MKTLRLFCCAAVLVVVVGCFECQAQSFAGLMRDELALGLTPTTASRGMGGAYVGVPGVMSMNPAALAFIDDEGDGNSVALSAIAWNPSTGPSVTGGRIDVILPFLMGGRSRFMGYYYETNDKGTAHLPPGDLAIEFDSATFGFQGGIPITDTLALGLGGYPYEKAEISISVPGGGPDLIEAEAFSQIGSIQAGLMWLATEEITLGVEGIYIIDQLEAELYPAAAVPWPTLADDYHIHYVAVGGSWRPFEKTLLAVDFRTGEIEGLDAMAPDGKFDQDVKRWNFGVSQEVLDWLTLRVGSSNGGLTVGASAEIAEKFCVDYSYVEQAFRDLDTVFDAVRLHSLSVSMGF